MVSIDEQVTRRLQAFREFHTDLERYAFLRDLQDTNETLYYALLGQNVEELLPIVYTPTVGAGCKSFSRLFRKPRGLFLSIPHRDQIRQILANPLFDKTEVIVVTDGERILGLGDQGAGGMGIPIGKLAIYTACGGIDPATALPILLDVGTDNEDNLNDPLYIGWRHKRVRGEEYDSFIEEFIGAVAERWPHVMMQWEDFAKHNATRLLDRYRDRICSFNDDIQGTAAVATGALLAAINVTGVPLKDQRIAILGGGSAGCGIANLVMNAMTDAGIAAEEAARRFYLVDKDGLLVEGMSDIAPFQKPFLQPRAALAGWNTGNPNRITLLDVIYNAKPTALIGVSAQAGAFTETVVRAMAKHNKRPIIFPLSNPITCAEATPADIERWSDSRAVIGAGSPFPPIKRNGQPFQRRPDQQFLHLPRRRLRRHRDACHPHLRRHVHGRGQIARRDVAGARQSERQSAAALSPHCARSPSRSPLRSANTRMPRASPRASRRPTSKPPCAKKCGRRAIILTCAKARTIKCAGSYCWLCFVPPPPPSRRTFAGWKSAPPKSRWSGAPAACRPTPNSCSRRSPNIRARRKANSRMLRAILTRRRPKSRR